MKTVGLIAAIVSITTATGGKRDNAAHPTAVLAPTVSTATPAAASQLPLLFIVDGVRFTGDQVPLLSADLVATVQVIKGHLALKQYGPEASYGVVIITTKLASGRGS
ncbi:MAG TPA: hypothetical protein VGO33_03715 [Gemmatimonadaceae bacterium]|jgi:hypothetical protein|nr:hypothetical protein [Gemmatimonadaceae bacterium]